MTAASRSCSASSASSAPNLPTSAGTLSRGARGPADSTAVCPGRVRLLGQVLDRGMPIGGARVRLDGPSGPRVKSTDDEGQFRVADVQKGSYHLEIGTLTQLLSVDHLTVEIGVAP